MALLGVRRFRSSREDNRRPGCSPNHLVVLKKDTSAKSACSGNRCLGLECSKYHSIYLLSLILVVSKNYLATGITASICPNSHCV